MTEQSREATEQGNEPASGRNGDSAVTDVLWTHYYAPNKIGTDTIYHSADYPSALTLPVTDGD